ncbi:MAG: glutamate-5-semialdehyde dehydrogenase [Candidatus Omnitrophota bacterium]|nr:glutamate-5-semialdehyde dehydrogenase [Candidatus Omnitrophota bacterium]
MSIREDTLKIARQAKKASLVLANLPTRAKNKALLAMARALRKNSRPILSANKKDLLSAKRNRLSAAFIDRLMLNSSRILKMSKAIKQVAELNDPVGDMISIWRRPNGIIIGKVRVPLGVIAIIYESRPDVTSECSSLCLKSGNSVILRGGKEAICSNIAIWKVLSNACRLAGLPKGSISFIQNTSHQTVDSLLKMDQYINLVIPRGGENLIERVTRNSRIPVIKHYKGVCHIYVDKYADLDMAERICFNAKCQRPGVCNAMETLLVHKAVADKFLPFMAGKFQDAGVEIRGCKITRNIVKKAKKAVKKDWFREYLALILAVKVVSSLDEAIGHIAEFGSGHSDAIITADSKTAFAFLKQVDSAAVYVNASTRFTDGREFGMGSEIGISTDKIHARGPMGLEELTSYKYIILGNGQIRK